MIAVEVSPGILELDLLTPGECDGLVEAANSNGWVPAEIVSRNDDPGHVQTDFRTSDACFFHEPSAAWSLLHERIMDRVVPAVSERWGRSFSDHSELHIVRYRTGQFFKAHTDSGDYGDGTARRYFTVVCYLNENLQGGGTSFPDTSFTALPRQGRAVVFPADYLHQGDEILGGTKYIAVTWLIDQPPVAWI